jgi:hypothetical protein
MMLNFHRKLESLGKKSRQPLRSEGWSMTELEDRFLSDTIAILIGYDGCNTVESLKGLIDEARERLIKLRHGHVTENDI